MARRKPWEVSDELWAVIEPLLPKHERRFRHPGRKRIDDRKTLQGVCVLVPLLFMCALVAAAVLLGVTGAAGEFAAYIVGTRAMAAAPLAGRFGVTVLDALVQPPAATPAPRQDGPQTQPTPEPVRA